MSWKSERTGSVSYGSSYYYSPPVGDERSYQAPNVVAKVPTYVAPIPVVDIKGAINRLLAFAEKYAKLKHLAFKGMSPAQFSADLKIIAENGIPTDTKEKIDPLFALEKSLKYYESIYNPLKLNSLISYLIKDDRNLIISLLSMALQQRECNTKNEFNELELRNTGITNINDLAFVFKHISTLIITIDDNFQQAELLLNQIQEAQQLAGRDYHVKKVVLNIQTLNYEHLTKIRTLVPADSNVSTKIVNHTVQVILNHTKEDALTIDGSHVLKPEDVTKLLNYIPANRSKSMLLINGAYCDGIVISDSDVTKVALDGNKLFLATVDDIYENILKNFPSLNSLSLNHMTYINPSIATKLANMIFKVPNLKHLYLSNSGLSDTELKVLIPYIVANKDLTIDLTGNTFSDQAIEELATAIYANDLRFTSETLKITMQNKSLKRMFQRNKERSDLETTYNNVKADLIALKNDLALKHQLSQAAHSEIFKKGREVEANIKRLSKMRYPTDEAVTALQVTLNNLASDFEIMKIYTLARATETKDMHFVADFLKLNLSSNTISTANQITRTNIMSDAILSYVERHRSQCVHFPYIYNYSRPMTAHIQDIIKNPVYRDRAKAAMTDLFKQITLSTIAKIFNISPPEDNKSIRYHSSIINNHDLQILIKNIEVAINIEMFIQPLMEFFKKNTGVLKNYFNPNAPLLKPLMSITDEINKHIYEISQFVPNDNRAEASAPSAMYEAGAYAPVEFEDYDEYEEKNSSVSSSIPTTVPHIRIPNLQSLATYTHDHTAASEAKVVVSTTHSSSSSSSSAVPNQNTQSKPYTRIKELIAQLSAIATPADLRLLEMRYPVDEDLLCKISLELMTDPVNDSAGDVFDRTSLEDYFTTNPDNDNLRCPLDDKVILSRKFSPNKEIRKKIIDYYEILIREQTKIVNARIEEAKTKKTEEKQAATIISSGASGSPVFTSITAASIVGSALTLTDANSGHEKRTLVTL